MLSSRLDRTFILLRASKPKCCRYRIKNLYYAFMPVLKLETSRVETREHVESRDTMLMVRKIYCLALPVSPTFDSGTY